MLKPLTQVEIYYGSTLRPSSRQVDAIFSYTRYSEKCFTHIYRDLYGDAMLVLSGVGVNRSKPTDGHALNFASKA